MGIAIASYVHAVAWIAQDDGHFRRVGLKAKVDTMGGSAATIRTLISGDIDLALAGGDAVLKANAAGADLVVIGTLVGRFYHRIVVRDGITDLRGKKIGIPFLGGPQDMAVKVALRRLGLKYGEDVEVVALGKEFNRMAALTEGEIDATTSQTPATRLKDLGVSVLVDLPATDEVFPYIVIAVQRERLRADRVKIENAVAALCEATRAYRDERNRDAHLKIIAEHLGNADVEGAAEARYRDAGPSLLALPPLVDRKGLQAVVELAGLDAGLVDRTIDDIVLRVLESEGKC